MKTAVVGAAGRLGSLLVKEGCSRGHEVTAVVRDVYMVPDPSVRVIESDVHDLTAEQLAGSDAVIDAFGVWERAKVDSHITSLTHLADILSGAGARLLVAGTAGNLYIDKGLKTRIIDLPDFPKGAYPVIKAMCDAYELLKVREDVKWTYFSPAPDFRPDESRSGVYRIAGELLPRNMRGKSGIGYADFAAAIFDEAERNLYGNRHISVYSV